MANAVVPYHHANGPREVQVFEPGAWAIRLHFRVYRACCNQLNNLALFVFCQVSSPLKTCFQQARNVSVVDYCYTTTLRGINRISQKVFDYELIDSESCKTLKQKQREREIAIFRASLGENTVYSKFCRATASYISEAIPNVIGEKLEALPGFTEGWLLYRLGLPLRYINYQLIKKTGYREELISSQFSKSFKGNYCGLRTRLAHLLLGKHNLDPILDFEHLLLQLFVKIMEPSQGDRSQKCIGAAVRSLAQSFSYQEHIDRYLAELPLRSDEEALIARLEWHKTHDTLPKGVPDPHQERLTPSNLYEKFEEALYKYTESLVEKLVDRYSPPSMKRGLSGFVYFLEGRDASIRLLTHLVAEFGIKQLTDPHLFSLAILYACNEDIMDYELDGFGRRKKDTIIDVGQEMMNAMLEKNFSWSSTLALFEDSGLRHTPGSLEGIMQKTEAKEQLRRYIASIIHEMIKEDDFQHKTGVLRAIRRKTKRFPVVGVATVSLHVLINGMFFSLGYPFRDIKQEETTFLKWMFKHMTGKGLCNYLADRVVDLIYHPSWRITLMQVLETVWETFQSDQPENRPAGEPISRRDFGNITNFLVQHFVRGKEHLFGGNTTRLFDFFAGETVFNEFKRYLRSSNESFLEKGLEALLPTIKELLLYCRVVDGFRKECISFEGDTKFWELFLRESLNRLVAGEAAKRHPPPHRPSLVDLTRIREEFLDGLLSFDARQLCAYFSRFPNCSSPIQGWEVVPDPPQDGRVNAAAAGPLDLTKMIRSNYLEE